MPKNNGITVLHVKYKNTHKPRKEKVQKCYEIFEFMKYKTVTFIRTFNLLCHHKKIFKHADI
jgi:hypothetical protein